MATVFPWPGMTEPQWLQRLQSHGFLVWPLATAIYTLPIRNTLLLQTGHVPLVAGLPFFIVAGAGLRTSRLLLHLTRYASTGSSTAMVCGTF